MGDTAPSAEIQFKMIRAMLRALHELSMKTTGHGFVIHDIGGPGVDLHSDMAIPIRVTFPEAD